MAADQDIRADWEDWRDVGKCELWQAVVLTMDIDPKWLVMSAIGRLIPPGDVTISSADLKTIDSRIRTAVSNLGDGVPDHSPPLRHTGLSRAIIVLREFGEWAPAGWNLPTEFPGVGARRAKSVPSATPTTGGVSITLPHTTKDLEALFAIIREHWADPTMRPKGDAVGLAVDKAMGWNSPNGKPSRTAQSIAGMIRPDEQADADKRSRRRRKAR